MMKTSVQFVLCDILKMLFNSNFSPKYIYAIWSQHFSHMILPQSPQKKQGFIIVKVVTMVFGGFITVCINIVLLHVSWLNWLV